MVNQQKIITMTKLALYDKHEGTHDREANDYFRHDYIYRKNLATRISVGIGGVLILALYWLRVVFVDGIDIFEIDIQYHATDSILFIIALVAFYSVIGTVQGTREYYLVQKRLNRYQNMLRFLEEGDVRVRKPQAAPEEKPDEHEHERERRRAAAARNRERERERERVKKENNDPLANVSARALSSGSRPRTPLTPRPSQRPSQRSPLVRLSDSPKDSPLVRKEDL
ncbi:MAG: hypothetical protein FWF78_02985 [Defluviitaleaceae bacterium]|nr:hypothetical protein [Defluviitaleaceae bacterium]